MQRNNCTPRSHGSYAHSQNKKVLGIDMSTEFLKYGGPKTENYYEYLPDDNEHITIGERLDPIFDNTSSKERNISNVNVTYKSIITLYFSPIGVIIVVGMIRSIEKQIVSISRFVVDGVVRRLFEVVTDGSIKINRFD